MPNRPDPAPPEADPAGWFARVTEGRGAWRLILALLALYLVSFAAFYPRIPINDDESMYMGQAQLLARGQTTLELVDPRTGESREYHIATYPLGTAALMTPLIWAFGWRAGFLLPCLSLILAVLVTARWLREEDRSPLFALLVLGFPPALVMGRVTMSDVPSAAVVALGLWLFWRGLDRGPGWWLASGFLAGLSLTFRASNPLVFVPLFAGTVLRRERRAVALVVGGLAGLGVRMLSMLLYFGSAFFERASYPFSPGTILERLPLYLLGLLVCVPGGLALGLAYRGRRRPEVVATIALFVLFYLLQDYSTVETGARQRFVLALRYFIPLLPLLAFAMAESAPRLWGRWLQRSRAPARWAAAATLALGTWLGGVAVGAAAVHAALDRWTAPRAGIREAIEEVVGDRVLVSNLPATRKYLDIVGRRFLPLDTMAVDLRVAADLVARNGEFYIALFERGDTRFWRAYGEHTSEFLARFEPPPELLLDRPISPSARLHIWRVARVDEVDGGETPSGAAQTDAPARSNEQVPLMWRAGAEAGTTTASPR